MRHDENSEALILIGIIGKAQGINGQMRLQYFGGEAADLAHYSCFFAADGREYKLKELAWRQGLPVLALAGVETRSQAEQLTGTELYIKRGQLADNLADDEFYQADLLGFAAFDEAGAYIGRVSGFFNFGGGDLLELSLPPSAPAAAASVALYSASSIDSAEIAETEKRQGRAERKKRTSEKKELIPFSKAAVSEPDWQNKRLVIQREAAGLLPAKAENSAQEADKDGE